MPTYEYRCKACGEHLEVVQSFTDDALTDCPACDEPGQLRKVFGSIGITFKGSGFYKTDSRAGSKSSSSSGKDGGESSSTSGESKPSESKSESKPSEPKPSESKSASKSDSTSSSSSSTSAA
jgi:putative FmdB family regulatory protein